MPSRVISGFAGLFLVVSTSATHAGWDTETKLISSSTWSYGIAGSGTAVHVIWGTHPILYRRSMDDGATWSSDVTLAASGEAHLTDPIAAAGSNVYVIYLKNIWSFTDWCCARDLGDIYLKRSTDSGATWEPEKALTKGGGAYRLSMAVAGPRIHIVWNDERDKVHSELYYLRSSDGGATWDPEVKLVASTVNESISVGAGRPQLAALGEEVHVAWMDGRDKQPSCYTMPKCSEVYYKHSLDGGTTWGNDVRLTQDPPFSGRPDIALLSSGTVVVAYDEDSDSNQAHEQHMLRSTDSGKSWRPSTRISFGVKASSHNALVASGASAHLTWFDKRSGSHVIYYSSSDDSGATWQPEQPISNLSGDAGPPLLALTSAYLHVLWKGSETSALWYRRKTLASRGAGGRGEDRKPYATRP